MKETANKSVPAADKTLKLLEYMASPDRSAFGVTEIADALGYNKGTVHSILRTMVLNQWVQQEDQTGKYYLTNKLWRLARNAEKSDHLVNQFLRVGAEMERSCGELINLHYLRGTTLSNLVAKVSSRQHSLRVDLPLGADIPVIASSAGKCLICNFCDDEIRTVFDKCSSQYTMATIRTAEAFLEQIHHVRQVGYATNEAEYEDGVYSVAAPVRDAQRNIVAAVNIVIPVVRYTPERKPFLKALVKEGAAKLSALQGYQEETSAAPDTL